MNILKRLRAAERQITAIDRRWTDSKGEDKATVATESIPQLEKLLAKPDLDPGRRRCATELLELMEKHLKSRR